MDHQACAQKWIHNLENIDYISDDSFNSLEYSDYILVMKSFITKLLKQPETKVCNVLWKKVPIDKKNKMTPKELIVDTPREKLYRVFELLDKCNGDITALITSNELC